MNKNPLHLILSVIVSIILISSVTVSSQVPILDEQGRETGLVNLNPDRNGEPWIAGGDVEMTEEERAQFIPLVVPEHIRKRQLPAQWDNTTKKEFRPIFNQKGGSCAQASGIAYTFTYEINCLRDLASNVPENQYPYGFTYNFLNRGSTSNGSSYSGGWNIVEQTGCPTIADYLGTLQGGDGSQWLDGYEGYYKGMCNKVKANDVSIKVTMPEGIEELKQWLYDHAGEQQKGGLVTFSSYASGSEKKPLPSGTPQAGEDAILKWGTTSGGHAMTIGGWDDEVRWDYNGDGQYTNDLDINNDGVVDPCDWEIGAVIMINSWGSSWGNSGKAYMMYWVLANPYEVGGIKSSNNVYGIHCYETYEPQLTYKVTLTHDTRNLIRVRAGMSNNISATTPSETHSFSSAFNYSGGALPMKGNGLSSTIEIGLDVTPLFEEMTGDEAKFFLQIDSKGGTGKVDNFSIIDYSGGSPVETVCDQTNVTITPGTSDDPETTYLTVLLSGQPRITVISPNGGEKWEQNSTRTIAWGDNIDDNVRIELYKGGTLKEELTASTESDGEFEWNIPETQEVGSDYTIKITCVTNDTITDESNADFAIEQEYVISQFPHVEPFEELDTGKTILPEKWEQLAADDIEWIVLSGPTPSKVGSSPDVTGPDGDHTSGDGNYVYIEASNPNNPGKKAEFITPKFDITSLENPELTFWSHMFSDSNHMGDLYLDIYVDGTWKNEVLHLTDNHDDAWFEVTQSLSEYVGSRVIFRFRGITGESWASDICIDDFKVTKAENTPVTPILQVSSQFTIKYSGSRIHYQIPEGVDKTTVSVALYNIQGKLVMEQKKKNAGSGYYYVDLRYKLAAGLYICRMHAEHFTKSISIVLAD